MSKYEISEDFFGGNIIVESMDDSYVKLRINYRDSHQWFYWAFKVTGAEGMTITFDFGKDVIGYFGPAVSYDLLNWKWAFPKECKEDENDRHSFTYTFSENENEVYFSHHFQYSFENFKKLDFLSHSVLCKDTDGVNCPVAVMGDGENTILLTARHHACESPASYILEGFLMGLNEKMPKDYKVIVVPFVDAKGSFKGDQGKGRAPHDHNRDYIENSIYPTTTEIKKLLNKETVKYAFDFHSPLHIGGDSDILRLVNTYEEWRAGITNFSNLLAEEITDGCFLYNENNITWRDAPVGGTFSNYLGLLENTVYEITVEAPYFGSKDNIMTAESYVNTGKAFARAMNKIIK